MSIPNVERLARRSFSEGGREVLRQHLRCRATAKNLRLDVVALPLVRSQSSVSHRLPKIPKWATAALQGLWYWMGYRESLYRGHPVPEAAMVNEACNLIYANLTTGLQLLCEWRYSFLVPPKSNLCRIRSARADLIVARSDKLVARNQNISRLVDSVVEVKRGSAQSALIKRDLLRLAEFKSLNPQARAFLFLVSEAKLPKQFVSKEGLLNLQKRA